MVRGPAPSRRRRERALSSNDEAAVSRASARSDGFDNVDGGPECGVYIQMRGIEQVRIRRGFQGGDRPAGVALVAAQDVGQDLGLVDRLAGGLEFERRAGARAPPAWR